MSYGSELLSKKQKFLFLHKNVLSFLNADGMGRGNPYPYTFNALPADDLAV